MLKRLLFLFILVPIFVYSQAGKIAGTVTDAQTGEPLIGVNISLANTSRGATTDINGDYVILNVPVGTYDINFNYIGYKDAIVKKVSVSADLTSDVNYAMEEGVVELGQEIVVVAERPMIRKDETNTNIITTADQISQMPVRTIQDVAALSAGVVRTENSNVMNIRGGRGGESSVYIDGVLVNDPYNKAVRVDLPASSIEEISVQTGGFNAEYGESMSGIVIATTKQGTKNYSAMVDVVTDGFLSSYSKSFGLGTYSYGYNQYTLSVGGPIIPGTNHSFYFSGMRKYQEDRDPSWGYAENDNKPSSLQSAAVPINSNSTWSYAGKMKFDLMQGMDIKLSGAWTDRKYDSDYIYGQNPVFLFDQEHMPVTIDEHRSYNATFTHALSQNSFYDVKLNYFSTSQEVYDPVFKEYLFKYGDPTYNPFPNTDEYYGRVYIDPNSPLEPDYRDPGAVYNDYFKNSTEFIGGEANLTYQLNEHTFKTGLGYKYHTLREYRVLDPVLLSSKADLTDYERWQLADVRFYGYDVNGKRTDDGEFLDVPRDAENDPTTDAWKKQAPYHPIIAHFYIQDKIEFTDLIINLGLRYDYIDPNAWQFKELGANTFGGDEAFDRSDVKKSDVQTFISPRLGLSFPVTTTTVFHAQYGKFFQPPNLADLYLSPFYMNNWATQGYFTTLDNPNLKPPKTTSYEVGFRQMLGKMASLQLTAFYKETEDLTQVIPVQTDITTVAFSNNGDFGTIKGFDFIFNLQDYKGISARINYEMQFARGTGSSTGSNFNIAWQQGSAGNYPKIIQPLTFEQRHTGSININYRTEEGAGPDVLGIKPLENVGVNLLYTFNSGRPYTKLNLIASNPFTGRDEGYPSEQPYSAVNAETTPWNHRVDLRIDRRINLDIGLNATLILYTEIINLLNTENIVGVWASTGSPNRTGFLSQQGGQTYFSGLNSEQQKEYLLREQDFQNYGVPRQIRLGARFVF